MRLLIVYDRPAGQILRSAEHEDPSTALQARLDAEREYRDRPEVEIVVLAASSLADMQNTHRRYWMAS